ncbi:MAG: hypothetical protein L0Z70_11390 [Chloroflexi bacterium]|nr:hypothetical protein [Chloroflexota bacterium]
MKAKPSAWSSAAWQLARRFVFLALGCLILAACAAAEGEQGFYLPPTPAAAALTAPPHTPTPLAPAPALTSSPPVPAAASCVSSLRYLEDITIPDGQPAAPGEVLDKRWRVENDGECNWDERYRLKRIAGPEMGVPAELALYPARSATQIELRIVFTAPSESGVHRSAWQAYDPQGAPFGDPIFIEIVVQ